VWVALNGYVQIAKATAGSGCQGMLVAALGCPVLMAQWYTSCGGYLEALFTSRFQVSDALSQGNIAVSSVEWIVEGWMWMRAVADAAVAEGV
jgi:hypothetical protein